MDEYKQTNSLSTYIEVSVIEPERRTRMSGGEESEQTDEGGEDCSLLPQLDLLVLFSGL